MVDRWINTKYQHRTALFRPSHWFQKNAPVRCSYCHPYLMVDDIGFLPNPNSWKWLHPQQMKEAHTSSKLLSILIPNKLFLAKFTLRPETLSKATIETIIRRFCAHVCICCKFCARANQFKTILNLLNTWFKCTYAFLHFSTPFSDTDSAVHIIVYLQAFSYISRIFGEQAPSSLNIDYLKILKQNEAVHVVWIICTLLEIYVP